ncbi:MAG: hypothetical protein ABSA18_17680, partial [Dehalococcoidia bacterium]
QSRVVVVARIGRLEAVAARGEGRGCGRVGAQGQPRPLRGGGPGAGGVGEQAVADRAGRREAGHAGHRRGVIGGGAGHLGPAPGDIGGAVVDGRPDHGRADKVDDLAERCGCAGRKIGIAAVGSGDRVRAGRQGAGREEDGP